MKPTQPCARSSPQSVFASYKVMVSFRIGVPTKATQLCMLKSTGLWKPPDFRCFTFFGFCLPRDDRLLSICFTWRPQVDFENEFDCIQDFSCESDALQSKTSSCFQVYGRHGFLSSRL